MPGVKFTPDAARQIVDTVRRTRGMGPTRLVGPAARPNRGAREGWHSFKNSGSQTVPPYGVMRVLGSTVAIPGDPHNVLLECQRPDTTFARIYAVNGPIEVAAGQFGECRLPPFDNVEVLYDTAATPSLGEGWGPKPDSFKLTKHYPASGIVIATLSDLEGSETVLVSWHPITSGIGKANGSISNRASGAISIWHGTLGSESEISDMDPTAFNLGPPLESGDWINWDHINGQLICHKLCDGT